MENYVQCDDCEGWYLFESCSLHCTFEEMASKNFTCKKCVRVLFLEKKVLELETRVDKIEGWEKVRKGAKAAEKKDEKQGICQENNRYLALQDKVDSNEDDRKVVIVGASNVNRFNSVICRNEKRRRKTAFAAFPGGKIKDVDERVRKIVGTAKNKTKVIFHVGTNDMAKRGSEEVLKDFRCLIRKVKTCNSLVDVAVCSVPNRTDRGGAVWSRSEGVNNRLFNVCRMEGAEFIDLRGVLAGSKTWLAKDGVHYSREGAEIVGKRLSEVINSFLG